MTFGSALFDVIPNEDELRVKTILKKLTAKEIACLLGFQNSDLHILELLGYEFSTEGQKKFRTERPDFYPQISEHIAAMLQEDGLFPAAVDRSNPGAATFIFRRGPSYTISSLDEIGIGKYERFESNFTDETQAIQEYVRRVANPDFISVRD